jgi:hypothetical protein
MLRRSKNQLVTMFFLLLTAIATASATYAVGVAEDADLAAMSMEDLLKNGGKMVREMEEKLANSFKLLEEAMDQSDIATTTLRNDAITAMKGLVKLSEENLMTLQQRIAERNREAAEHEFVKISIARAKVAELYAQVKTASGIDVDIEESSVERTVNIGGSLPQVTELTSTFTEPPSVLPDPPVHASPYF